MIKSSVHREYKIQIDDILKAFKISGKVTKIKLINDKIGKKMLVLKVKTEDIPVGKKIIGIGKSILKEIK